MSESANVLSPQTELEGVNSMLASIGEDAVTDLAGTLPAEVDMAQSIQREVTRQMQLRRWQFNTEFGYRLVPDATFTWTNADATTIDLSIFKVPTNMVRFGVAQQSAQFGIDLVARKSVQYTEGMVPAAVKVLYDRANNRDGLDASKFTDLYIDPVWMFGYEDCPESFRSYVTARSARILAKRALGSTELSSISKDDAALAYEFLLDDQGEDDSYNIFDNMDVRSGLGIRPGSVSGFYDNRSNVR